MIITEKACNGCHACYNICPTQAIMMDYDNEGFLYPNIDLKKCIKCGLCVRTCPLNSEERSKDQLQLAYLAFNNNRNERLGSSSGGVFVLLSNYVLSQNGVVYGAAYDENYDVCHMRINDLSSKLQTSKYVQSSINKCFYKVKEDLSKRKVLFTGTPCQVAGLRNYLEQSKTNTDNLYLLDIICHGVPSPLVWKQYIKEIANGRKIKAINFRDKTVSWKEFSLNIVFENGNSYRKLANEDFYMRGFLSNLFLRPSCHECNYKSVDRVSDITLGDYWGIENKYPTINYNEGVSAVIIHSKKGKELFDSIIQNLYMEKADISDIVKYNSAFIESVKPSVSRKQFFKGFKKQRSVLKVLGKIFGPSIFVKGIRRLKRILKV